MRIRIVKVSAPKNIVQTYNKYGEPNPVRTKTYYKLQTSHFGILWSNETDPETGMLYPTFDTLETAERYVAVRWFEDETVVKEYRTL